MYRLNFDKLPVNFNPLYLKNYAEFGKCHPEEKLPLQISIGIQNLAAVAPTIPEIFNKN